MRAHTQPIHTSTTCLRARAPFHQVAAGDAGRGPGEANPFGLAAGDTYYEVHAEMVTRHAWIVH